ncbi:hypothetical protein LCGC14_2484200 [marine sediment metagenome]|uniref:DhaL domain-containing protein n=1 Tax=marine sediment metagenome TaxID=412755 RepID=A0A0F9B6L9_9ZZZZ
MQQGPNVKKLIIRKMSKDMVPDGGGLPDALVALATPGNLSKVAGEATKWVEAAIAVVKTAPDNPYGDDDEAIAEAVLKGLGE